MRNFDDYSERYWQIKKQLYKKYPFCYYASNCRFSLLHRCTILNSTKRDECKWYKEKEKR